MLWCSHHSLCSTHFIWPFMDSYVPSVTVIYLHLWWSCWNQTIVFKSEAFIQQGLSIRENICAKASRKIWRFNGSIKLFLKNTMWKLSSRAFQWCILRGGQHLVEVSQNEDFLQKTASKTAFWGDTNLDQVTLSSHNSCSKSPNLENYHIFGILRTSAFRWAIGKPAGVNIVRLAAVWNFLPEYRDKLPKTEIFCFRPNYSSFWTGMTYPG